MLLYYIRHGDPTYDPDELTPLGHRQAEAIARRLYRYGLDEVYVSSSNRARQTAQPTCELLKLQPTVLDWANESHAWREMTMPTPDGGETWGFFLPEIQALFTSREFRALGDEWLHHERFEGTSFANGHLRIRNEARAFVKALGFAYDGELGRYKNLRYGTASGPQRRIALFAHHGVSLSFLSAVLDIPFPQICLKTNMTFTGMSVIEFPEQGEYAIPQLLTLSDCGHLLAADLPEHYNNCLYL